MTQSRGPTILVVDDDPGIRRMVHDVLRSRLNAEVVEAEDGEEAINLAKKRSLTAAVIDAYMPWANGPTLVGWMRADAKLSGVPIVGMSGVKHAGAEMLAAGCVEFLTKPFRADSLVKAVEAAIQ